MDWEYGPVVTKYMLPLCEIWDPGLDLQYSKIKTKEQKTKGTFHKCTDNVSWVTSSKQKNGQGLLFYFIFCTDQGYALSAMNWIVSFQIHSHPLWCECIQRKHLYEANYG